MRNDFDERFPNQIQGPDNSGSMISRDIAFAVLSCLPNNTLLKMKCVSKKWYDLISSPSFIEAQMRKNKSEVSGFFFQPKFHWCGEDIKEFSNISLDPVSLAKQEIFDFLPEDVVILASCNGLVCCRSCFPSQDPLICVFNPSNKDWVNLKLPPNDTEKHNYISIALAFDPARHSTNFTVVALVRRQIESGKFHYGFEIYNSEKGVCRTSKEIGNCNSDLSKKQYVYNEGILHWLTDDGQVLTFDVEREFCQLISVPMPFMEYEGGPESCIGEWENQLHYIIVAEEGIQVWGLENYFEHQWILKISKSLKLMEEEQPEFFANLHPRVKEMKRLRMEASQWIDPLAFKDGILMMRVSSTTYAYKVETSEIVGAFSMSLLGRNAMSGPTVLPYSTSTPPFSPSSELSPSIHPLQKLPITLFLNLL